MAPWHLTAKHDIAQAQAGNSGGEPRIVCETSLSDRLEKRRLEMLAYSDLGPIALSMFHPGDPPS